ncbi:hypothetical protein GCM10027442_21540 [Emticicia fontis]
MLVLLTFYSGKTFGQQTIENNRICLDPISGTGAYIGTPLGGGVCALCNIQNPGNVVDGNLGNYATVTLGAQLLSNYNMIIVKDSLQYYPAGNEVGFIIAPDAGLLNTSVLGNLSIQTYRNNTLVETATIGGSPAISLAVLQGTTNGKQILSFTTTGDFDEVRLVANGTVSALTTLRIYEAFEGPTNCAHDCVNALTGAEVSNVVNNSVGGLLCLGSSTTSPGNVNDTDSTNFANISIPIGLGCTRYIEVQAAATYAAGTFAGFVIKENNNILGLNLLGGITIRTYNGSTPVDVFSGTSLLSAVVLNTTAPTYQIGGRTTLPFNRIRIEVSGVASLLTDINIYYAYIKLDSDNDGIPDCMDKCSGDDLIDTDGDGTPDTCDRNVIDLSLSKTVDNSRPAEGGTVTFTITATRDSVQYNATGVKVTDILPAGLNYVTHSNTGSPGTFYSPTTGIWTIGSALGGTTNSVSMTITATVDTVGVVLNVATITASNETDTDNAATSDNIAAACVSVPIQMCQGQSMILIAPSAPSYQWYLDGVPISGATNDSLVVTASGDYTVNFTTSSGCAAGNCCPIIINVNALPVISAGSNVVACAGVTSTLTATGTGTFLWNTGATTSTISVSPTLTTNYIVTLTNTLGCANSDTVTVTANPAPLAANAVALCSNNGTTGDSSDDTFTIILNPSGGSGIGTNYTVTLNGSAVTGPFAYGTASTPISAGLISTGSKTLVITDSNTCSLSTLVSPPASCSSCGPKVCVPITIVRSE